MGKRGRPLTPWPAHFWKRVTKYNGHWIWTGRKYRGVPKFSISGFSSPSPLQITWHLKHGEYSELNLKPTCGHSACINPDHLAPGDKLAPVRTRHRYLKELNISEAKAWLVPQPVPRPVQDHARSSSVPKDRGSSAESSARAKPPRCHSPVTRQYLSLRA